MSKGQTLSQIANIFGITTAELRLWNAVDPRALLQPGMSLQIFASRGGALPKLKVREARQTRVLVAGTPEFIDHTQAARGRQRLVVEAKDGDNLAKLGKRYGMSGGWMERINHRSRWTKLKPGERVVVYTRRVSEPAPARQAKLEPLEPVGEKSL